MADPLLYVLAGPNGAGKSTLYTEVLWPTTRLELINADVIAAEHWPDDPAGHAYAAALMAGDERDRRIEQRRSFATETVFSHESKIEMVQRARSAGYLVTLHIVMIPEGLAVARVANRVEQGGHDVPEDKVRARYQRLWGHLATAIDHADQAHVYDNSRAQQPLRLTATYLEGRLLSTPRWPGWAPAELRDAGRS